MKRIPEPFRIKMVEPIRSTDRSFRRQALDMAGLNPFLLKSEDVVDRSSHRQRYRRHERPPMGRADARRRGLCRQPQLLPLRRGRSKGCSAIPHVIPTHQGRGAEQILFPELVKRRGSKSPVFLSNYHFDTTKAHVELAGAKAINVLTPAALATSEPRRLEGQFRSRGAGPCDRVPRPGQRRRHRRHRHLQQRRRPARLDGEPADGRRLCARLRHTDDH